MKACLFATSLSTGLILAGTAWADVTPEDIWADFERMMSAMGMSVDATPERDGDMLVVRDVMYTMELGGGVAAVSSQTRIPEISFKDIGGGKVEMSYTGDFATVTTMPEQPELEMPGYVQESTMRFDGPIIAEGDPGDILYRFDAIKMEMNSAPVVLNGETIQPAFSMTAGPLSGSYSSTQKGDDLHTTFDMSGAALAYQIDPFESEGGTFEMGFAADSLGASGVITVPQTTGGTQTDILSAMTTGMMDVEYGIGGSKFTLKMSGPETGNIDVEGTSGTSALDLKIADGQIAYGVDAKDTLLRIASPMVPGGAADIGIGVYQTAIGFPIAGSETPRPVDLSLALEELVLPQIAWRMVDPTNQLPHDPATLRLKFNGMMTSDIGLFELDKMAQLGDQAEMPFQMKSAAIPELFLSLAGATIEGSGAGIFLDGAPSVPGGMPPFAGKLSLTLTGVTGLLDKLSATGILPPEQAMGAQMMLGMLARPGEGSDVLVSEIEMREDGSVLANGAPLPF